MFTEILSVVVLLAIPIVVIVHPTFGWLPRSDLQPPEASQRFYMRCFRFFRFPSDFEPFLAIKCKQNQGSPPSASLTLADLGPLLASVVGQAHCCSVVIVNNKNSVQLPTFGSSSFLILRTSTIHLQAYGRLSPGLTLRHPIPTLARHSPDTPTQCQSTLGLTLPGLRDTSVDRKSVV